MSQKGDEFRARALAAEASASTASDPEVKRMFLDAARSWHALGEMSDRGQIADVPASKDEPGGSQVRCS
jgi:hypothetical protein